MIRAHVFAGALLLSASVQAAPPAQAPAKSPDPWAGRSDLFQAPTLTPSTKVNLGVVQRFNLPNGLQVIAVPRPQLPAVDITLVLNAGNDASPIDRSGLAAFTAAMLRKGTSVHSADQIADAIDFVGGDLDGSANDDGTFVSCQARSKDLKLCLDLLAEVVTKPTFPEAEMGEIRDQMLSSVEGAKDSPQRLASLHGQNLFFGDDDPRGRPVSQASLAKIDRAALLDFYGRFYAPNNALLVISGDFDGKAVSAQLKKVFGGWKRHPVPARPPRLLPQEPARMQVRLVDKPDATQSAIVLLGPGIKHADGDYTAVRLMNFALGAGGFSSRLMKVVRSEGGKTYGAHSNFNARRDPGPFLVDTFTRTEETVPTLELLLREIKRMAETGPDAEELLAAKGNLIGGYGLHLETGADVARVLLTSQLDGLPADWVATFPRRLSEVTLAQAARAAAQHLRPTSLVIVGKAAEVRPQLERAGFAERSTCGDQARGCFELVSYTDPVSAKERAAEAARGEKAEKEAVPQIDPEDEARGRKLLATALRAKGADKLGAVKDIHLWGSGTIAFKQRKVAVTVEEYQLPGVAIRQDLQLEARGMTQVLMPDGHAFIRSGGALTELPLAEAAKLKHNLFRDPTFVLLNASRPGVKIYSTTDGELQVLGPDAVTLRLIIDPKSHLVSTISYTQDGREVRDELSDYRLESGVNFAHHFRHTGEGQDIDVVYDKVQINKGLPADTFKK